MYDVLESPAIPLPDTLDFGALFVVNHETLSDELCESTIESQDSHGSRVHCLC